MADKSSIEWTDATWNPIRGCSRISPGCQNSNPTPDQRIDATNPPHYKQHGIEGIDVLEALDLPFHLANVVKYIWRHRDKNGIEDLKKARWYLDRYIARKGATE